MSIVQSFYDNMANHYDKLYEDWHATTCEQAEILDRLFRGCGFDENAKVLDCACGIGTQAIGVAALGYDVTASDISTAELAEAKVRAEKNHEPAGISPGCAMITASSWSWGWSFPARKLPGCY